MGENIFESGEYLTKERAGELLGLSPRTLDRWARIRFGPPRTLIGHRVAYRRASLMRWLEGREQRPGQRRRA